ncbi:NKG2-A/NKG2-B type II integral membrane protein-like [Sorex fumeus]|uniref:NKG2-A/NKG2-B type II integral membrane protein-like n=1 Tax=Sorex fumeus TaxID=62283 RepID=UPI0024AE7BAE|nr:NKG2-A/NKG2-B type II integral membrane protein-like [Sorex fumeus]
MNNQRVTYEELNLHKDWKRRQKEPQDSKSSDTVTEQEITYAEFNFQNSCQDPQGNDQQLHSRAYNCNHCPEEWFIYSNSCYYISNEKRTWNESMMACVSKNSKLLYIDNPEEMNIFVAFDILLWSGPFNETNDGVQMWSGGSVFSSKS